MTPKQVAIKLIKHYVKRGDSLSDLKKGQMGMHGSDCSVSIGGAIFPKEYHDNIMACPNNLIKKVGTDKILVKEIQGITVNEIFSLEAIFNEIKNGNIQKTLL